MRFDKASEFTLHATVVELSTDYEQRFGVRSIDVRYRLAGTGSNTLLAIHGYSDNSHSWQRLTSFIERLDARLLAIDLPGHGETPFDLEHARDYVDFCAEIARAVASAVAPEAPVVLIANSLGGVVSLRALGLDADADRPWIRGALLLSPATPSTSPPPFVRLQRVGAFALAEWTRRWVPRPIYRASTRTLLKVAERMALARRDGIDPAWTESRLEHLCRPGSWPALGAVAAEVRRLLSSEDAVTTRTWEALPRVSVPVTLQRGRLDRVVGRTELEELLQLLPDVELHDLDGIGHCPQLEAPELVVTALERLLERIDLRESKRPAP